MDNNHEQQKNKNMVLCMLTSDNNSHNYALDASRRSLNPVEKHFNNVGGVL